KPRLIAEILADRPVIVMWDYSDVVPGEDLDLPSAEHYLIITGYDDVTDRFRVFDPWLGDGSIPGEPEVHEYYVSYEEYVDPEVKLGMPVSAIHDAECYNLRRFDIDAPQVAPPATDFDRIVAGEKVVLEDVDFDEILRLDHDIKAIGLRRIVYAHDGKQLAGPKRVGEAVPIVGLTTRQLLHAHGAPHRLLIPRSWALIAPVLVGQKIVDSFQMYRTRETWKQGGCANTRGAQLMVKAAERLRKEVGDQARPYLVSIPEQVKFFAACGEGEAAKLISLENVANGPVQSGKQALADVLKFIEVQRENAKRLRPDRPR
ncbi:MAG TPA: C39 family peptidase, partial [Povalibacter sp.]